MSPSTNMFASMGSLQVHLGEVVDIAHQPKAKRSSLLSWGRKPQEIERKYVHIEALIQDTKGKVLQIHQSVTKPFMNPTETFLVGEEFVFHSTSSTNMLIVSLCSMSWNGGNIVSQVTGTAQIPLSRLEENRKISQWYQLVDPISQEGLRTAVRIECTFFVDRTPNAKSVMKGNNRFRARQRSDEILGVITGTFGSLSDDGTQDGGDTSSVAPSPHKREGSRDAQDDEERYSGSDSEEEVEDDVEEEAQAKQPPTTRRRLVLQDEELSEELKGETEHDLLLGIVDYCLVLGPSSPYSMRPSHRYKGNNQFDRYYYSAKDWDLYQQSTSTESSPERDLHLFSPITPTRSGDDSETNAGLFSPFNSAQTTQWLPQGDDLEAKVWDRMPAEDHADIELPSKIEWFACPEGAITVLHETRPPPLARSFALCAGDSEEIYSVCLSFFVRSSDSIHLAEPAESDSPAVRVAWWGNEEQGEDEDQGERKEPLSPDTRPRYLWSAVTVCLLFRTPYLVQLARCLAEAYRLSIAPKIAEWEEERERLLRSYGVAQQQQQFLPSEFYSAHRQELLAKFPPCHLFFESLFSFLCVECPVPIPNLLDVSLRLSSTGERVRAVEGLECDGEEEDDETEKKEKESNYDEEHVIRFHAHNPASLPRSPYPLRALLDCFGARTTVDILCCILCEARMLFHSADVSKLTVVCEGFRTLLYPLTWTHVYLPVVPVQLLNLVEAPVPFILGTHSENLAQLGEHYLTDVVLVDCDSGALQRHAVTPLCLPEREDRWLVTALSLLATPAPLQRLEWRSSAIEIEWPADLASSENCRDAQELRDLQDSVKIQLVVFDVLLQLLRFVPDCLFYLNPACPVFNRSLFMSDYCTEDCRGALDVLTVTNAFHTLTEMILSPALRFFRESIARLNEEERQSVVQDLYDVAPRQVVSHSPGELARKAIDAHRVPLSDDEDSSPCAAPCDTKPVRAPLARNQSMSAIIYDKVGTSHSLSLSVAVPPSAPSLCDARPSFASPSSSLQRTFSLRSRSMLPRKTMSTNAAAAAMTPGSPGTAASTASSTGSGSSSQTNSAQCAAAAAPTGATPPPPPPPPPSLSLTPRALRRSLSRSSVFDPATPSSPARNKPVSLSRNEELYRDLLPAWVLSSSSPSLSPYRASGMRDLLHMRVNRFLPRVFPAQRRPRLSAMSARFAHALACGEVSWTLSFDVPVTRCLHERVFSVPLGVAESAAETERKIEIETECDGEDDKPVVESKALLVFERERVVACERDAVHWTLSLLATHLHCERDALRRLFRGTPHTLLHDSASHSAALTPDKPFSAAPRFVSQQRNLVSHAMVNQHQFLHHTTSVANNATASGAELGAAVDGCITEFLQKIVTTSDLDDDAVSAALRGCLSALALPANRAGVVKILKQAKKQDSHHKQQGGSAGSNVYPLNSTAFDAFNKLFNAILSICFQQEDFITAFELLEVAGHYFRVLPEQLARLEERLQQVGELALDDEDESDLIEFLSEKACHHPIYQTPVLWKSLMHHRLPLKNLQMTSSRGGDAQLSKFAVASVMTEVRSLLYMMLGMGVNSARALSFIQSIASDYQLGIDEYFKLQRFASRLWALHETHQLQMQSSHPAQRSPDFPSSSSAAAVTTSGGEIHAHTRANPFAPSQQQLTQQKTQLRRNSVRIADLMAQQGHAERVIPNKSRELSHLLSFVDEPAAAAATRPRGLSLNASLLQSVSSFDVVAISSSTDVFDQWMPPLAAGRDTARALNLELPRSPLCDRAAATSFFAHSPSPPLPSPVETTSAAVRDALQDLEIPEILSDPSSTPSSAGKSSAVSSSLSLAALQPLVAEQPQSKSSAALSLSLSPAMRGASRASTRTFDDEAASIALSRPQSLRVVAANSSGGNSGSSRRSLAGPAASFVASNARSFYSADDFEMNFSAHDAATTKKSHYAEDECKDKDGRVRESAYHARPIAGLDDVPAAHQSAESCTALDSVSNWLLCGTGEGAVNVIDLRSFSLLGKMHHSSKSSGNEFYEGVTALHALPVPCGEENEFVFFSGCSNGVVKCWALPNHNKSALDLAKTLSLQPASPAAVSPGAAIAASPGGWRGTPAAAKLRAKAKHSTLTVKTHNAPISCLASNVYHNGSYLSWLLASGDRRGSVTVVKYKDELTKASTLHSPIDRSSQRSSAITTMCFVSALEAGGAHAGAHSAADPLLAVGCASGKIAVLDLATGLSLFESDGHFGQVSKVVPVKPNEFLSCGFDRSIKLWDIRMKTRAAVLSNANSNSTLLTGNIRPVYNERSLGRNAMARCAASPITEIAAGGWDNSLVISASADGMVRMWDLRYDLHKPCNSIHAHHRRVSSIVWNGRKEFYTSSYDGTVKSWDSINGHSTSVLHAFSSPPSSSSAMASLHGNLGSTVLQDGIASMRMTEFTSLEDVPCSPSIDDAHATPHATTKIAKNSSVIVAASVCGSVKVFGMETTV